MKDHKEFVVEYKDGTRDWVDPVVSVVETGDTIVVTNGFNMKPYEFDKKDIDKWQVRVYHVDTTYNWIE